MCCRSKHVLLSFCTVFNYVARPEPQNCGSSVSHANEALWWILHPYDTWVRSQQIWSFSVRKVGMGYFEIIQMVEMIDFSREKVIFSSFPSEVSAPAHCIALWSIQLHNICIVTLTIRAKAHSYVSSTFGWPFVLISGFPDSVMGRL